MTKLTVKVGDRVTFPDDSPSGKMSGYVAKIEGRWYSVQPDDQEDDADNWYQFEADELEPAPLRTLREQGQTVSATHRQKAAELARDAATLLANPWATVEDVQTAGSLLADAATQAFWAGRIGAKKTA